MITLDPAGPVGPSEQIRAQIAGLIRSGELPGQHRLPAIRQLAADLRVAPGTVAKAYALLEEEGLIETSRARGTRVAPGQEYAEDLLAAAQRYIDAVPGLDLEQALGAVRSAWRARHAARREV